MRLTAAERRRQILEAAAIVFARQGFHPATMDDVARAAGVSPGLIYRHFPGKEDLIVALVEAHERDELAHLARASAGADFPTALERYFIPGGAIEEWRVAGMVVVEVVAEALRNRRVAEVVGRGDAALVRGLADLIAGAQAAGQADQSLDPAAAAELLLALADGLLLRLALAGAGDGEAVAPLLAALRTLLARFLAPQPVAAPGEGGR